jgi:hypothetical protein
MQNLKITQDIEKLLNLFFFFFVFTFNLFNTLVFLILCIVFCGVSMLDLIYSIGLFLKNISCMNCNGPLF